MLFPIDIHYVSACSKTAYVGDTGTDIGAPVGTPVVAVGDGWVVYAEVGHTRWNKPPDTANSVRIKLDNPIARGSRIYTEVFYTHLSSFVSRAKGSRVKAGDLLGRSGIGNSVPHLHISFYTDDGHYIDSLDGQSMMWNEWLPEQINPKGEDDMFAYQSQKLKSDHEVNGLDGSKKITAFPRGRSSSPTKVTVLLFGEAGEPVPGPTIQLTDGHQVVKDLSGLIGGFFTARFRSNGAKFSLAITQE